MYKPLFYSGQLSEEAQEHRNKDFKYYRSKFARRCSGQDNLEDIFNRLLLTSDPLISSLRASTKKSGKFCELPEDAKLLLKEQECQATEEADNEMI